MSDDSYQYAKWWSEKKTGNRLGTSQQSSCDVFRRTDFWPRFGLLFTMHIVTKGQENSERIDEVIVSPTIQRGYMMNWFFFNLPILDAKDGFRGNHPSIL